MKQCPQCNRTYADDTLSFCLDDGSLLSASYGPQPTVRFPASSFPPAENLPVTEVLNTTQLPAPAGRSKKSLLFIMIAVMILVIGSSVTLLMFKFQDRKLPQLSSPSPTPSTSASPTSASAPPTATPKKEPTIIKEAAKPNQNQITDNNSQAAAAGGEKISVPKIYGKTYDEARKILIREGWQPDTKPARYGNTPEVQTGNGPVFWERGYSELVSCSGTGAANCLFEFVDPDKRVLVVITEGEENEEGGYHAQVSRVFFKSK